MVRTKHNNKIFKICLLFAVFGSSMVGSQLFGISLNKIALMPLMFYILLTELFSNFKATLDSTRKWILLWYGANLLSCMAGLIYSAFTDTKTVGIENAEVRQLIQIALIYIPLALGLWHAKDQKYIKEVFQLDLKLLAKVNAIWGLAQFILYYTSGFQLNTYIFDELFGGMLGAGISYGSWTTFLYVGSTKMLRVTGLNYDAAYFGIILVFGFILEKKLIWKTVFFLCAIISFSRTSIVLMIAVILLSLLLTENGNVRSVNVKKALKYTGYIVTILIALYVLISNVPLLRSAFSYMIERFLLIFSGNSTGTNRHMGYLGASLQVCFFSMPIINKLFGIGLTCGGCALRYFSDTVPSLVLSDVMALNSRVWAIEMDYANCILGTGIIGTFIFIRMHLSAFVRNKGYYETRMIIIALAIGGIMYLYSGFTLVQLIYILLFAAYSNHEDE